jgi:hypothetical protein
MQLPPGMMPPGGGGGMPPVPPGGGGMPPGGGGAPPMGGMIAQVLQQLMRNPGAIQGMMQQLMRNPAAMQGMQNFMRGQSPTAGMQVPPSQGGPIPPGMTPNNPIPVNAPSGGGPAMPMPPPGAPPPGAQDEGDEPPTPATKGGGPPPDAAEAAANSKIGNAGYTWDGVDAPTKNDIERLKEDPTPAAIKSFDKQFGPGMAEKYLGDQEEQGESQDEESAEGDQGSASSPEYDE